MSLPILDPLRPQYITKTFVEVWDSYDKFKDDYDAYVNLVSGGIAPLTNANAQATFYLLYAKYGNSPILY